MFIERDNNDIFINIALRNVIIFYSLTFNRIQKKAESAADADYPSYGVTGPNTGGKISPSSTMSDRKLAQSAQMFHYQQQRQQMMAQEKYAFSIDFLSRYL